MRCINDFAYQKNFVEFKVGYFFPQSSMPKKKKAKKKKATRKKKRR
jgi:hypothetical protein